MSEPTFEDYLEEWLKEVAKLKQAKKDEMRLRKFLFNGAFPNPCEGSQKITLGDGREVTGTLPYTREIDLPVLNGVLEELAAFSEPEVALVFGTKPTFSLTNYRKVGDAAKKIIDKTLITKPGTPTLKVG